MLSAVISPGALIKEARRRAGVSQAEVARRVGVKQPTIARLEAGGANPRVETLNRVIAATGHSLQIALGPSPGIDETMIVEDLRRSPDERLRRFESFYRSARELGGKALR
jgi:transcriptional regulator with XRE-family HTH domain